MSNQANLKAWARKYDLEAEIVILIENGFDTLQSVVAIDEKDLDTMGLTKVGTKKKF